MKVLLTLGVTVIVFRQVYANNTIPIFNTVFRGVYTVFYITRPQQVISVSNRSCKIQPSVVFPQIYYGNARPIGLQKREYAPYVVPYGQRYVRRVAPSNLHKRYLSRKIKKRGIRPLRHPASSRLRQHHQSRSVKRRPHKR